MTLTADAPRVGDAPESPPLKAWTGQYIRRVLLSDIAAIGLAGVLAVQLRFGSDSAILNHGNSSYYGWERPFLRLKTRLGPPPPVLR